MCGTSSNRTRTAALLLSVSAITAACGGEAGDTASSAPASTAPPAIAAAASTTVDTTTTVSPTTLAPTTTAAPTTTVPTTVAPTTTAAATTVAPTTTGAADEYSDDPLCSAPPVPAGAVIGTTVQFDLGPDSTGHRVYSYLAAGIWRLRVEFSSGVSSEIDVPSSAVFGVRPIGFTEIDDTRNGDELIAVVGGGASTVLLGVFGFRPDGCLQRYERDGGGEFVLGVGASTAGGEGMSCGPGFVAPWGYQLEADGTYSYWSAAYGPVGDFTFGYIPASDDFGDGLTLAEISAWDPFDCGGLTL